MFTIKQNLYITGKVLDQHLLLKKIKQVAPKVLIGGGVGYAAYNTYRQPEGSKKKSLIQDSLVLTGTIGAALASHKMTKSVLKVINSVFKKTAEHHHEHFNLEKGIDSILDEFKNKNLSMSEKTIEYLDKAKTKVLTFSQVKHIYADVKEKLGDTKILNKLIPDPHAHSFRDILEETTELSLLGLFPILGGIAGGVAADKINKKNVKSEFKNKAKEGFYQFASNIVLCNVGAAAALFAVEKSPLKENRAAKCMAMIGGIFSVGVFGGSYLANLIGKNLFNPVCDKGIKGAFTDIKNKKFSEYFKDVNSERKPELIDIGLHTDDLATVSVLAGLKWITPILPILYSVSGYRAGIGYRNNGEYSHHH